MRETDLQYSFVLFLDDILLIFMPAVGFKQLQVVLGLGMGSSLVSDVHTLRKRKWYWEVSEFFKRLCFFLLASLPIFSLGNNILSFI